MITMDQNQMIITIQNPMMIVMKNHTQLRNKRKRSQNLKAEIILIKKNQNLKKMVKFIMVILKINKNILEHTLMKKKNILTIKMK
jgi:hypothetical protein